MKKTVTIQQLLDSGKRAFEKAGKDDQLLDVRLLLEYVLDCNYAYILVNGDQVVEEEKVDLFNQYIEQRLEGKPYHYIVGQQEFMGLTFYVDENTLIPRRDTEVLVEFVNGIIDCDVSTHIMDVGTGTGCIPISICSFNKKVNALAIDISKGALAIAEKNSRLHHVNERMKFIHSDLFAELTENDYNKYDILISNPPYIPTQDVLTLMEEVKDYEPASALDGGEDGLDFYRQLVKKGYQYIKDRGYIVFEIGHDQYEAVKELLEQGGFKEVSYQCDLSGIKRVIYGVKTLK